MKVKRELEVNEKRSVYLYLTDWQMRMVKDFLGIECDGMEIPVKVPNVFKYGPPWPPSKTKRMYLTDWQMRELKDEMGITCDFIELSEGMKIFRYGAPTS